MNALWRHPYRCVFSFHHVRTSLRVNSSGWRRKAKGKWTRDFSGAVCQTPADGLNDQPLKTRIYAGATVRPTWWEKEREPLRSSPLYAGRVPAHAGRVSTLVR